MKNLIMPVALAAMLCAGGCSDGQEAAQEAASAAETVAERPEQVELSPEAQRAGGIKTVVLKPVKVMETFEAMGRVMQDAQKPFHATAGAAGRVESVSVTLGQKVKAGDALAVIKSLSGENVGVAAGHAGIVTALHSAEGDAVNEMTFIATITDTDPLWGVLDVPERKLGLVRKGQAVDIKTEAYPGRSFSGNISFISPEIDAASRTVKVRVAIANPDGLLKFGMFIDCVIRTGEYFSGLALPSDAVQNSKEGQFVFVKTAENVFAPRAVETGREKDGLTEIKKGVSPGDTVVTEGAYLVKSEMMKSLMGED